MNNTTDPGEESHPHYAAHYGNRRARRREALVMECFAAIREYCPSIDEASTFVWLTELPVEELKKKLGEFQQILEGRKNATPAVDSISYITWEYDPWADSPYTDWQDCISSIIGFCIVILSIAQVSVLAPFVLFWLLE